MCAAFPHFLRFLKKNTPSHVRDQYVVLMQKGINIGPVVWPLTPKNGSKLWFSCSVSTFFEIFEKKYAESRPRPICSSYAKGHQNRPSSLASYPQKTVQNDDFRAAFPHFLRFLKKNTPSHVRDQYVVRMQKGIKIGPVVWPLIRSFSHSAIQRFIQ